MDPTLLPLAHETWFVHGHHPADWHFAGEKLTLLFLAIAVAATLAVRLLARIFDGVDVPILARMAPWMPFALRIHLAVSLIGLLSLGDFLSPQMDLPNNLFGVLLGAVMVIVAIAMATGFRTREAAWLLVASGPAGMLEFGAWPVLARIDLLGLAVFLLLTGPGAWSADAELGRARLPALGDLARGVWALRVAVGTALIVVAFQEKLANPSLATAFLHDHPDFNVAHSLLQLDWTDLQFTRVAGAVEVLFGLLLISGALPQACVLVAGIPFNATLWFFGAVELIGHLPTYGTMLVLLVFGSHPALRRAVSDPWPFGRRGRGDWPPG
jgi:uncharacterized membrane protein YphA (DoxX/SURF4 family)